jgi:hypothetical protein
MVRSEDSLQVFGIKVHGQFIRFDQIATQHSDLSAFGWFRRRRWITVGNCDLIANPRDGRREHVSSTGNCSDEAPITVCQGPANIADAMREGFICYSHGRPYGVDKLVLRHQPASILDKVFQDREALGPQLNLPIVGTDTAAPKIERKSRETERLPVDRLHQTLPRTRTAASDRFHHFWRVFAPKFHDAGRNRADVVAAIILWPGGSPCGVFAALS